MPLQPGLSAHVELTVANEDLATTVHSGLIDVLATPRVVALCEQATVLATQDHLEAGQITLGTRIELDHSRASISGATVVARAKLSSVEGRRLVFEVTATEGDYVIASGLIGRAIVDRQAFTDRLGI